MSHILLLFYCILFMLNGVLSDDCSAITTGETDCNANADCNWDTTCKIKNPFKCGSASDAVEIAASKVCDGIVDCPIEATQQYGGLDETFCGEIDCFRVVGDKSGMAITMQLQPYTYYSNGVAQEKEASGISVYNADFTPCGDGQLTPDTDTTVNFTYWEDKDATSPCITKETDDTKKVDIYTLLAAPTWFGNVMSWVSYGSMRKFKCIVPGDGYVIVLGTQSVAISAAAKKEVEENIFPTDVNIKYMVSDEEVPLDTSGTLSIGDPFKIEFSVSDVLISKGFNDISISSLTISKSSSTINWPLAENDCPLKGYWDGVIKLAITGESGKRTISLEAFSFANADFFTIAGEIKIQQSYVDLIPNCPTTAATRKRRSGDEQSSTNTTKTEKFRVTRNVKREVTKQIIADDCKNQLDMYMQVVIGLGAIGVVHLTINIYVAIKMKNKLI